jgi:hypothetical protein
LSISGTSWDSTTVLVINIDLGSRKSVTAAVSSVQNSDSIDPVLLVELNFPPLSDTSFCVGKFVSEGI